MQWLGDGDKVMEETFGSKMERFGWLTNKDERKKESRMTPKILA